MTSDSSAPKKPLSQKRVDLLGALLQEALVTGRRHQRQFSQLAALARAIESPETPAVDRVRLLALLGQVAADAEAQSQLDLDMFENLLGGRVMKRQAQQEAHQGKDVFVVAANDTRH
jgi:hypothetical protein